MLEILKWFGIAGGATFGLYLFWKFAYSLWSAHGAGVPTDVKYEAFGLDPPPGIKRREKR